MKKIFISLICLFVFNSCTNNKGPASPDSNTPIPNTTVTLITPTQTLNINNNIETSTVTPSITPTITLTTEEELYFTFTQTVTFTYEEDFSPTSTPEYSITEDAYEPNNNYNLCTSLEIEKEYYGSIYPEGDQDWFCLNLTSPAAVSFVVETDFLNTDVNIFVLNNNFNYLFGDTYTISNGQKLKFIRYLELTEGNYFAEILDYFNQNIFTYTFKVNIAAYLNFTPTFTLTETKTPTLTMTLTETLEIIPTLTITHTQTQTFTETSEPTVTLTPTQYITPDIYEDDDGCGWAKEILKNQCQERSINNTDIDWIYFDLSEMSSVTIETSGDGTCDTFLELRTDCSGLVASDDNGGEGLYSKIQMILSPGNYQIKVTAQIQSEGLRPYTICFSANEITPTFTVTNTFTLTETNTNTPTFTYSVTFTNTITDTPTNTFTFTHTLTPSHTPTVTNTALPGTVWLQAIQNANFTERYSFGLIKFDTGNGEKMYIIGGEDVSYLNQVYESEDGVGWTSLQQANPFTPRSNHLTLVYDNKVWIICGEGVLTKSDIFYSSDLKNWYQAVTMTALGYRTGHSGCVFNPGSGEKMYVTGGFKDGNLVADVFSSADGINWTELTSSASFGSRYGHRVCVFDNKIWLTGGIDNYGGNCKNDVWYSINGIDWINVTSNAAFSPRYYHAMFEANGKLWIIGGADSGNIPIEDCWYSEDGLNWIKTSDNTRLARYRAGGLFYSGKMWLIGGITKYNDSYGNEVLWSY